MIWVTWRQHRPGRRVPRAVRRAGHPRDRPPHPDAHDVQRRRPPGLPGDGCLRDRRCSGKRDFHGDCLSYGRGGPELLHRRRFLSLVFAVFAIVRQRHGQPLAVGGVPAQPVLGTVDERIRQVFQALEVVAAGVGCGQRSPARADDVLHDLGPVEVGPGQAGGGRGKTPGPAGVFLPGCAVWRRKRLPLFLDDGSVGGVDRKYSEIVWLPTGRTASTSTNADALTGLPNTYCRSGSARLGGRGCRCRRRGTGLLFADHAVMATQRLRHGHGVGLPQPDAALDVGEQQRHRSSGEPHSPIVHPRSRPLLPFWRRSNGLGLVASSSEALLRALFGESVARADDIPGGTGLAGGLNLGGLQLLGRFSQVPGSFESADRSVGGVESVERRGDPPDGTLGGHHHSVFDNRYRSMIC